MTGWMIPLGTGQNIPLFLQGGKLLAKEDKVSLYNQIADVTISKIPHAS